MASNRDSAIHKAEKLLKQGRMYINIHTDVWVAGEVRGQILPIRGVR